MAYATTDSKLTNLDADNFFETTLKTAVSDGTDTNIYLNALPTATEGFLTIEPTGTSTKEIIFYNAKGADYVTCPSASAGRGVGGTTAQGHLVSSVVRMAPVAEIWRVLRDRHVALAIGWERADTTHTCGSDNIITVPSDAQTKYSVSTKLEIVVSGTTYYGYATAVAATALTGIFATAAGDAYTLSSGATITSMRYSNAVSPVGFPQWFNWTPSGYKNDATTAYAITNIHNRFKISGREVSGIVIGSSTADPSGASIFVDAPVTASTVAANRVIGAVRTYNGTNLTTGRLQISQSQLGKIQILQQTESDWGASENNWNGSFKYEI